MQWPTFLYQHDIRTLRSLGSQIRQPRKEHRLCDQTTWFVVSRSKRFNLVTKRSFARSSLDFCPTKMVPHIYSWMFHTSIRECLQRQIHALSFRQRWRNFFSSGRFYSLGCSIGATSMNFFQGGPDPLPVFPRYLSFSSDQGHILFWLVNNAFSLLTSKIILRGNNLHFCGALDLKTGSANVLRFRCDHTQSKSSILLLDPRFRNGRLEKCSSIHNQALS